MQREPGRETGASCTHQTPTLQRCGTSPGRIRQQCGRSRCSCGPIRRKCEARDAAVRGACSSDEHRRSPTTEVEPHGMAWLAWLRIAKGNGGPGGLPNSQPAPGAVDSLDGLGGQAGLCQRHALAFPPCTDLTATKLEHGCSIDRKRRAAHAVSDLHARALHRTYRGPCSAACPLARLTWAPIGPVPKREGPSGLVGKGLVGNDKWERA